MLAFLRLHGGLGRQEDLAAVSVAGDGAMASVFDDATTFTTRSWHEGWDKEGTMVGGVFHPWRSVEASVLTAYLPVGSEEHALLADLGHGVADLLGAPRLHVELVVDRPVRQREHLSTTHTQTQMMSMPTCLALRRSLMSYSASTSSRRIASPGIPRCQ